MTTRQRRKVMRSEQNKHRAIWILAAVLTASLLVAKAQVNTDAARALHQHNVEIGVTR